jgi:hypothetical protein
MFSPTHTAGMHVYTEKLCEIYPKIRRDLLKNFNKSQKNESWYLLDNMHMTITYRLPMTIARYMSNEAKNEGV